MNILYVPTKDPRLTNGGNEQRTNLLWESLKRFGKVYTFMADKRMENFTEKEEGEHPIYKYKPIIRKNSIWIFIDAVLSRISLFNVYRRNMINSPNPLMVYEGVNFDLVVTRYLHPLCDYKYWEIAPLLVDIDDHPLQVYETVRRKQLPFGLKKIGEKATRWQTNYLIKKSEGGWMANKEQATICKGNFCFLPNIPQTPSGSYKYNNDKRRDLFTVGAMGYAPNREGVSRFLREVWPSFHERFPDVKYYIVGNGAPEEYSKKWNSIDGVKYLGFVDKLELLYEKSLATIVPVYSGGGTCIKTLESLSFSRICLSTSFGARGLQVKKNDGNNGLLIFDDSISFISQFEKVISTELRHSAELRGKAFVREHYSKESFENAVCQVIETIFVK